MQSARVRAAMVAAGATMLVVGMVAPAGACGYGCGWFRGGGTTVMSPVCAVSPAPYHVNRLMWTPSYGITSTCNPLAPGTCGYGIQTALSPVAGCDPCAAVPAAVTPVAVTTYRPLLWRLFHPFAPRPVSVTYQAAYYTPVAAYAAPCCPAPACSPICAAPGCGPSAVPYGAVSASGYDLLAPGCPAGSCAPAVATAPAGAYETAPATGGAPATEPGAAPPRTFKEEASPTPTTPELRMKPVPDDTSDRPNPSTAAPPPTGPVARRLGSPIHQATYFQAMPEPRSAGTQPAANRSVDLGGWRASRD